MPYTGYLGKLYYGATEITNLMSISTVAPEASEVDITILASSAKMFAGGIRDFKELSFECIYDSTHYAAIAAQLGVSQTWKIIFPDLAEYQGSGFLKTIDAVEFKSEDLTVIKGTIRTSGEWVYTP